MATPRFPRCFLSCSLHVEDRAVFEWFGEVLNALEFEVSRGDEPQARPPPEKIREMIRGSDAVVAVLTRRDKIDGRDGWRPPEWVQNEIGMAYDAGKPIAVFLEEGVEAAGLAPQATEYLRFDRANLGAAAPRIIRYLVAVRSAVAARPAAQDEASFARALAAELADRLAQLSDIENTLELNPLNWSLAYGRVTGRFYMLPNNVQREVADAYAALEEMSGLVKEAHSAAGVGLTFRSALLGKGPDPEAALKKEKVKAVVDRIVALRQKVGERVALAWASLLVVGYGEAGARFLRAIATDSNGGGPPAPPPD